MKKIKTALMTLFVCALGYGSYSAYDYITMSDAERFLLQNIEALTFNEPGGGDRAICYYSTDYHPTQRTPVCLGNGMCRYYDKCKYKNFDEKGESCSVTL